MIGVDTPVACNQAVSPEDVNSLFGKAPASRKALTSELALAGDANTDFNAYHAQRLLAERADEFGARLSALFSCCKRR